MRPFASVVVLRIGTPEDLAKSASRPLYSEVAVLTRLQCTESAPNSTETMVRVEVLRLHQCGTLDSWDLQIQLMLGQSVRRSVVGPTLRSLKCRYDASLWGRASLDTRRRTPGMFFLGPESISSRLASSLPSHFSVWTICMHSGEDPVMFRRFRESGMDSSFPRTLTS